MEKSPFVMTLEDILKLSLTPKSNITSDQARTIAEAEHGANCYADQLFQSTDCTEAPMQPIKIRS